MKLRINLAEKFLRVSLTTYISLHHKNIVLYLDLFHMNVMNLLHTKSSKKTFIASNNCISKSADKIIKELQTVTNMYKERGFNTSLYHGENELNINYLRNNTMPASLNICVNGKHIKINEIFIKTTNQGEH